jgi:hypothetical protein
MGTTPNLALPYPELTDPADVPADIKRLADKLDALVHPALVTALPGSPVDGQECYYQADAANGVIWQLRYRAASASTYKWEFVGGPPFYGSDDTPFSTASTTYIAVSPTMTVPLAGDYVVRQGCQIDASLASGWRGRLSFTGNDADSTYVSGNAANANPDAAPAVRVMRRTLTATSYQPRVRSDAGNAVNFNNRWLEFQPVRVG